MTKKLSFSRDVCSHIKNFGIKTFALSRLDDDHISHIFSSPSAVCTFKTKNYIFPIAVFTYKTKTSAFMVDITEKIALLSFLWLGFLTETTVKLAMV